MKPLSTASGVKKETIRLISICLVWNGSLRKKADGKSIILSTLALPPEDSVGMTICRYDLVDRDTIIKTEIEQLQVRLYAPNILHNLLKEIGFKDVKMIKAFNQNEKPESQDEVIVFECRK